MTQPPTARPTLAGGTREPTPAELNRARQERADQVKALEQLRTTADLWAKSLGAVLAALIGFSLIKGRSDVGQLASTWAAVVGIVLLLSVVAGAIAVFALLSAQGNPWPRLSVRFLAEDERDVLSELRMAAHMLMLGIGCAFACMGLLLGAVGATWYGPAREAAQLIVHRGTASWCGEPGPITDGKVTLKTAVGPVHIDLAQATSMSTVDRCPDP
jgi:hypothetical protein